jgi:hypothetical protein
MTYIPSASGLGEYCDLRLKKWGGGTYVSEQHIEYKTHVQKRLTSMGCWKVLLERTHVAIMIGSAIWPPARWRPRYAGRRWDISGGIGPSMSVTDENRVAQQAVSTEHDRVIRRMYAPPVAIDIAANYPLGTVSTADCSKNLGRSHHPKK